MARKHYLVRRIGQLVATLFVVASLMFVLFRLSPADPTATVISPALSPDVRASMAARYGLDQPLSVQYIHYLVNVLTFDFGQSFFLNRSVRAILVDRVTNTFVLMGTAVFFAFSLGTSMGAYAAWRNGSTFEKSVFLSAIVFRSIPSFLLGLLFLYVFAFELQWLPTGHMIGIENTATGKLETFFSVDFLTHLILPVVSLVPFIMAFPMLLMRTTMLEVREEDYITICRAKGVPGHRIFTRHAMRNSILPILTTMPIVLGASIAGNILIETIYSWPGIGRTLVQAVLQGDFPLAQGTFLLIAVVVIAGNFVVDLLYGYLDPRITYE
jgi:peptide/nickel transport system permease protein